MTSFWDALIKALKTVFIAPYFVTILSIFMLIIAEPFKSHKKRLGYSLWVLGLLISAIGIWWTATQQAQFQQKLIDYTTGGVNDLYLNPRFERPGNDHICLSLEHVGKGQYPHYDLVVIISNILKRSELWKNADKSKFVFDNSEEASKQSIIYNRVIGTIPRGRCIMDIMRFQLPKNNNELRLLVKIGSRNGVITEPLYFKKINNEWKVSYRVQRMDPFEPEVTELRKEIDPNIPLSEHYAGEL